MNCIACKIKENEATHRSPRIGLPLCFMHFRILFPTYPIAIFEVKQALEKR